MNNSDKFLSEKKYKNLKENEKMFRKISSIAQDAIVQIDDRGVIYYWNKMAEKIFEYSENEVLGKKLHFLIAPERFHKSFLKGMKLFRKTGKGVVIGKKLEIKGIKKDGTEFPIELSISSVRVNEKWNAIAFIRDITERKQAEDKYIAIFEHSPIAIELYDSDGLLIKVNKACLDLFGIVDIKEIEQFKLFDDPNIPKEEKDILKEGKTISYESEFDFDKVKLLNLYRTTKSGVIYLDVVITPLFTKDKQKINNYLVQIQDISERKKIEKELENIFTLSLNMIGSAGNDTFFKRINPAVGNTLGYTDDELLSKSFIDLIHPDDVESTLNEVKMLSEGKISINFVNRYRCKDGSYKWIEWSTKPVPEEEMIYFVAQDVTARKLNEQKLEEYSKNLEDIVEKRTLSLQKKMEENQLYLDIASVMLLVINADGTVRRINKKGCEILGYAEEQIIGKNWIDNFILKEAQKEIQSVFRKIMAGDIDPVEYYENPILTKEGRVKLIAWHNTILKDEKGNIVGTLSSGEDITKRKKADKKLKESEEKYRLLFENAQEGIWTIDENSKTSFVNPRMAEMLGYTRDKIIGKHLFDFMDEKGVALVNINLERLKQGINEQHDFEFIKRNGTKIYTLVEMSPLTDDKGSYKGAVAFISDISERKRIEDELLLERNNLINILNSMADGVYIVDSNYDIEYVNPILIKEFGPFEGIKCFNYFHDRNEVCPWCKSKEIAQGKSARWEWYSFKNQKTYDLVDTPLKNPDGSISKLEIFRDISDIKKKEQELKESEKKYREAYNRAEFYKDLFAHDINNILQSILSGIQISQLHLDDPEKRDTLRRNAQIIKEQVIRGAKLVSNVRKISQLEYPKRNLEKIEIVNVLKKVITIVKKSYKDKNLNIRIDSVVEKFFAKTNDFLEDVFENLLINAITHNRNISIEISVKILKEQQNGINYVKMEFQDNGIGVADSMKHRIFIRANRKEEIYLGMGLGLSLVRGIIESYNGKIWVEDVVKGDRSKGSNFVILIPEGD